MAQADSIDKIVGTYFAAVTAEVFEYKGKHYAPKPLNISAALFHEFVCNPHCAGCCTRFTLDYLCNVEGLPLVAEEGKFKMRKVTFNGHHVSIVSYPQEPRPGWERFCDFVEADTGYCSIHGKQPFTCDFETLRFSLFEDHAWLGVRPYGRGWNMLRVDGEFGAACEFPKTTTKAALEDSVRKLERLKQWTDHFGLERTYIPSIIEWAQAGPHTAPLTVSVISGNIVSKKGFL